MLKTLFIMMPLILSGILHMIIVTKDILPQLKKPIYLKGFGNNKTYRGVVVMPVLTIISIYITSYLMNVYKVDFFGQTNLLLLGFCLGLGYILAELPNSWMKRKMGIKPGELSPKFPVLFSVIDQADSALSCGLIYYLFSVVDFIELLMLVSFGTVLHLAINIVLFKVGLRKNPL
jgi:CDP-diglyceride synthetase